MGAAPHRARASTTEACCLACTHFVFVRGSLMMNEYANQGSVCHGAARSSRNARAIQRPHPSPPDPRDVGPRVQHRPLQGRAHGPPAAVRRQKGPHQARRPARDVAGPSQFRGTPDCKRKRRVCTATAWNLIVAQCSANPRQAAFAGMADATGPFFLGERFSFADAMLAPPVAVPRNT